jgi:benzil reductase ((S)-benzoin forming)
MRCVIITGVSRGLGRALAEQLLDDPRTRVVAVGRSAWPHERLTLLRCDFTRPECLPDAGAFRAALAEADAQEVVLIHNAAVVGPIGKIGELDPQAVADGINVNLLAPILITNAVIAAWGRPARIVFVSSGAARRIVDGWSVYSATKRGGEAFFEHLDATIVNPGVMDTGMQAAVRAATFEGQEHFHELYDSGRLPDAASVARRIIADHL